ncbi:MAG: hypothetical protein F6K11_08800 [Leptolyngbya sp. SIO3F4]|nr:hypothetical protein [Leptolyngbya sp. SIO3F4]
MKKTQKVAQQAPDKTLDDQKPKIVSQENAYLCPTCNADGGPCSTCQGYGLILQVFPSQE